MILLLKFKSLVNQRQELNQFIHFIGYSPHVKNEGDSHYYDYSLQNKNATVAADEWNIKKMVGKRKEDQLK